MHSISVAMINAIQDLNEEKIRLHKLLKEAEKENIKLSDINFELEKRIQRIERLIKSKTAVSY